MKTKLLVLVSLLVVSIGVFVFLNWPGTGQVAEAQEHKTIWCNPANTGTQDGLTKATGYTSLHWAMSVMSSGDTVIIADGDWSAIENMGISSDGHMPPPGIDSDHTTTVRAETDWGVKLPKLRSVSGSNSYITIQGIIFPFGADIYNWDHSRIIRCGFIGIKQAGNHCAFGIGYGSSYNLIEECIAWGGARNKFLDYKGNHNIFRRCVSRQDWYMDPDWHGQMTNFRGYDSHDDVWQNCIAIDSDRSQYYDANMESND